MTLRTPILSDCQALKIFPLNRRRRKQIRAQIACRICERWPELDTVIHVFRCFPRVFEFPTRVPLNECQYLRPCMRMRRYNGNGCGFARVSRSRARRTGETDTQGENG